jgi:hypothetical protein
MIDFSFFSSYLVKDFREELILYTPTPFLYQEA